jgi:flagellar biosynthesis GTPase FlhF
VIPQIVRYEPRIRIGFFMRMLSVSSDRLSIQQECGSRLTLRVSMDILARNNVHVSGRGDQPMVFAHGFGCDQNMWRFVAPAFEKDFKVVLFDHPVDKAAERKAALAYERERRTRERDQAKEEAARQKERERRQQALDKAQDALDRAKIGHEEKETAIDKEREAVEEKSRHEDARWERERARLESSLRRARDG